MLNFDGYESALWATPGSYVITAGLLAIGAVLLVFGTFIWWVEEVISPSTKGEKRILGSLLTLGVTLGAISTGGFILAHQDRVAGQEAFAEQVEAVYGLELAPHITASILDGVGLQELISGGPTQTLKPAGRGQPTPVVLDDEQRLLALYWMDYRWLLLGGTGTLTFEDELPQKETLQDAEK